MGDGIRTRDSLLGRSDRNPGPFCRFLILKVQKNRREIHPVRSSDFSFCKNKAALPGGFPDKNEAKIGLSGHFGAGDGIRTRDSLLGRQELFH